MDRQTFWPLPRALGGGGKNCVVAHPIHVSNSSNGLGVDSMTDGRTEVIAISRPLIAQDKLFHRQNAVRNFLIPST